MLGEPKIAVQRTLLSTIEVPGEVYDTNAWLRRAAVARIT
jgi:hypothetical protein